MKYLHLFFHFLSWHTLEDKQKSTKMNGREVVKFCHDSPWGGRVDTCQLALGKVLVTNPETGADEWEDRRTQQHSTSVMYEAFKASEWGQRSAELNRRIFINEEGEVEFVPRQMSENIFRSHLCPCLVPAQQKDAADMLTRSFVECQKSLNWFLHNNSLVRKVICMFLHLYYIIVFIYFCCTQSVGGRCMCKGRVSETREGIVVHDVAQRDIQVSPMLLL